MEETIRVKHRVMPVDQHTPIQVPIGHAVEHFQEMGYILWAVVPVTDWVYVAVFVGAESVVIPAGAEVTLDEPSETVEPASSMRGVTAP